MSESLMHSPTIRSVKRLALSLVLVGCAHAAFAQATLYTNRAAFSSAVGSNTTTINFDSAVTTDPITGYNTAAGLTLSGVNFVGNVTAGGYDLYAIRPAYNPLYAGWNGNPTVLQGPSGTSGSTPGSLLITLPANVTAVGMDLYTVMNGDTGANTVSPIGFTLSTGQTFSVSTFAKPTLAFAGFVSSTPITSITVQDPAGSTTYPNLSNFVFRVGGAASAPEPGAMALMGAFLLPVAGFVARRRSA